VLRLRPFQPLIMQIFGRLKVTVQCCLAKPFADKHVDFNSALLCYERQAAIFYYWNSFVPTDIYDLNCMRTEYFFSMILKLGMQPNCVQEVCLLDIVCQLIVLLVSAARPTRHG